MKNILKRILFFLARRVSPQNIIRQKLRRKMIVYKAKRQSIDQDLATKNLRDVVEVLEELDVTWFIDGGTCLGAIREKRFIPFDADIDFGILARDAVRHSELITLMRNRGFEENVSHNGGRVDFGLTSGFIRHGIGIDITYYYENRDKVWHAVWPSWGMLKHEFDRSLFEGLRKITFMGIEVYVPNPPEAFCEARYGDWRTPRLDWDWQVDTKCRVEQENTNP